ncbi:hypothetical protein [Streptomyces sp.]|uniref:hypothetical protein n=1 Tax=Streptomyces sp. TaxID=1931 RepID=UPI00281144C5|nr:hypothetical protein [Streptomyces sp.]
MSIIASLPILGGRDGVVLSAAERGLVLDRPREELTIPGEAVARVWTEGRTIAVELRARTGTEPVVHRVEDVDETAAAAFAAGVNALRLEPEEEIDGAALVIVRTRKTLWRERYVRRMKRLVLGCVGAVVGVSVLAGLLGDAGRAIAVVPVGFLATAALGFGVYEVGKWLHVRRVRKHGTRVFARPANVPGAYLYVDDRNVTRVAFPDSYGPYAEVCYDPEEPAEVHPVKPSFTQRFNTFMGWFLLFLGLDGVALVVLILSMPFE